jgi:hypothetical protein
MLGQPVDVSIDAGNEVLGNLPGIRSVRGPLLFHVSAV